MSHKSLWLGLPNPQLPPEIHFNIPTYARIFQVLPYLDDFRHFSFLLILDIIVLSFEFHLRIATLKEKKKMDILMHTFQILIQ
jgi:hypothetical protein